LVIKCYTKANCEIPRFVLAHARLLWARRHSLTRQRTTIVPYSLAILLLLLLRTPPPPKGGTYK